MAQTEDAGRQSDRQVGRRHFGLAASARRQQAGGEAAGKQQGQLYPDVIKETAHVISCNLIQTACNGTVADRGEQEGERIGDADYFGTQEEACIDVAEQ